jgi:hypothetical protein
MFLCVTPLAYASAVKANVKYSPLELQWHFIELYGIRDALCYM